MNGLVQIAVGPDADARGAVVGVVQGGDHDDRNQVGLAVPLELVADGEAVKVGEHQVEQDEVGRVLADGGEDLAPGVKLDRLEVRGRWTRLARISLVSRSSSTISTVRGMGKNSEGRRIISCLVTTIGPM